MYVGARFITNFVTLSVKCAIKCDALVLDNMSVSVLHNNNMLSMLHPLIF